MAELMKSLVPESDTDMKTDLAGIDVKEYEKARTSYINGIITGMKTTNPSLSDAAMKKAATHMCDRYTPYLSKNKMLADFVKFENDPEYLALLGKIFKKEIPLTQYIAETERIMKEKTPALYEFSRKKETAAMYTKLFLEGAEILAIEEKKNQQENAPLEVE